MASSLRENVKLVRFGELEEFLLDEIVTDFEAYLGGRCTTPAWRRRPHSDVADHNFISTVQAAWMAPPIACGLIWIYVIASAVIARAMKTAAKYGVSERRWHQALGQLTESATLA
jgi:hypothetical protein